MKKFTLLLSLMVPLLTGTAAAQALNLTPFAGSWKGELYVIDRLCCLNLRHGRLKAGVA